MPKFNSVVAQTNQLCSFPVIREYDILGDLHIHFVYVRDFIPFPSICYFFIFTFLDKVTTKYLKKTENQGCAFNNTGSAQSMVDIFAAINHLLQQIQVECLTATVVAFVVTVELICVVRQNDRRC